MAPCKKLQGGPPAPGWTCLWPRPSQSAPLQLSVGWAPLFWELFHVEWDLREITIWTPKSVRKERGKHTEAAALFQPAVRQQAEPLQTLGDQWGSRMLSAASGGRCAGGSD